MPSRPILDEILEIKSVRPELLKASEKDEANATIAAGAM